MSDKPETYYSPTLSRLKREARPGVEVVCASCRASMWRVTKSRLTCFCKEARLISWDGKQDPTLACDNHDDTPVEADTG